MKRLTTGLTAMGVVLLGGLLPACDSAVPESARGAPVVGEQAPDYAGATLAGDTLALAHMRGQVVLVNVWATWCAPCRVETPELQALHEEYEKQGLRVIGISIDDRNARDGIEQFVDEFGVTYEIVHDASGRVDSAFRLYGVPVTLLIGRDGTIRWRHLGPVKADNEKLLAALRKALKERPEVAVAR